MKEEPCKHVEGVDTGKRIRKNLLNIGVFITEILILVLLGPWTVRFFLPLLVGWLIAQIANPLVRFLEQHLHIVRKHSSMGIIAGAILLIVWICYLIVTWTAGRVVFLLEHLPEYYRSLSAEMTVISDNLESLAGHLSPEAGQKIGELTGSLSTQIGTIVGSLGGVTMGVAGNAAGKIPSLLISFLFVLLFAYFFTAQSERVQDFIKIIVPEETRRQLQLIGKKMKFAVGGYFRAQFKIMFIVFVILTGRSPGFKSSVCGSGSCRDCSAGFSADAWNGNHPDSLGSFMGVKWKIVICCRSCDSVCGDAGDQTADSAEDGRRQYWNGCHDHIDLFVHRIPDGRTDWNDCRNSIRVDPDSVV